MIEHDHKRAEILALGVEKVRRHKRGQHRLDEWFYVQECRMKAREEMLREGRNPDGAEDRSELLCRMMAIIPLSIPEGSAIAGSQDGAFSPSYALINPAFRVETFAGYCDPTAAYDDIEPDPERGLSRERIDRVRAYWKDRPYVRKLQAIYDESGAEAREVVYFMEPVTGHTIPDLRPFLQHGVVEMQERARRSGAAYGKVMARALEAVLILAGRYRELAEDGVRKTGDAVEALRLSAMAEVLGRVPANGAETLQEAIQIFVLLWQGMVLEQAPNPYAFSVGNLDRILEPYYDAKKLSRDEAVELLRHLLCFFQVGDRCWAISQNVIVGGRDEKGEDLSSEMTRIVLDAFFATNDPQPALSVKLHSRTPERLYRSLGRFFFTPGRLTPSLFNDDTLFELLKEQGVAPEDLADYAIAGCQEPLIMGKSSLNTTNTWLNLAKVLELALHDGCSAISGENLAPSVVEPDGGERERENDGRETFDLEDRFFLMLDYFLPRMAEAGNACTRLLGQERPAPLSSALMDGFNCLRDLREPESPGVRYNASGCLIHGLSVVADSIYALRRALESGLWDLSEIRQALQKDFDGAEELRLFLLSQEKYGNNLQEVDAIAERIAGKVSDRIDGLRNPAGRPYVADWSTPSTHLLYGYWVGATPDGRKARSMLGYGIDPLPGASRSGLPERIASAWKLPHLKMKGGVASHIGLDPNAAPGEANAEEKALWLRDAVIAPFFRFGSERRETPYYVYFNVDEASHLRRVLEDPQRHAPDGIYIMRIHGTFVNFLDLSPAIQQDIIQRLDPSTEAPHVV